MAKVTLLCNRSVLWASNMPKIRWRPGLRLEPRWGAHDAPQTL